MSAVLQRQEPESAACGHPDRDPLGPEGNAEFFRCRVCGLILVIQFGREWVLWEAPGGPENQDFTF